MKALRRTLESCSGASKIADLVTILASGVVVDHESSLEGPEAFAQAIISLAIRPDYSHLSRLARNTKNGSPFDF